MSVYLHPALAVFWAAIVTCECALAYWLLAGRWKAPDPFRLYALFIAVRDVALITLSLLNRHPQQVTALGKLWAWTFWVGQYYSHILALIVIFSCCLPWIRSHGKLPQSATTMAYLMATALAGTFIAAMALQDQPSQDILIYIESGAELFIAGVVCFALMACVEKGSCEDGILWGYFVAYALGMALYTLRAVNQGICARLYPWDLAGQAGALACWWIAVRRKHAK